MNKLFIPKTYVYMSKLELFILKYHSIPTIKIQDITNKRPLNKV